MTLRIQLARTLLTASLVSTCGASRADAVTDWNQAALNATHVTAAFVGGAIYQVRVLAHMHAAIFDTVNAIDRRYTPYGVDVKALPGASIDAAVASAAHAVLAVEAPAQRAAVDRALAAALAKVVDGPAKSDGVALGKQIAEKLLTVWANDGVTDPAVFQIPPPGPGVWQQTPQWGVPILYSWRQVKPMAIKDVRSYDIGGPPSLTSERYARDFNEIKAVGGRHSKTRTSEQLAVASYWTVQTMIPWNKAAVAASRAKNLGVTENARLFALLNIAAHDTQIVAMEQKYRYNFWRPYNAIRYAAGTGNAALTPDPNWEPVINTPGHPDYPSGHCTTSGGALGVLLAFFPDDKVNVSDTHMPLLGIVRSWTSFTGMAKEVEDARVWAGIHFRAADEDGTRIGRRIGEDTVAILLRPL
jgi:PAP2 superfamily